MDDSFESRRTAWCGDLEGELSWMQELACHLVRDRDAARELVQDAWLMALRQPPREQGRPRAWIGTVMRNLVRQGGRRRSRRGKAVEAVELRDDEPLPLQALEQAELEAMLNAELEHLGEPYRSALRDHYERGLTSAEIARRQRIPAGTVRWRLKTALDRLRARLDERCGRARWSHAILLWLPREVARHLAPPSAGSGLARVSRGAAPTGRSLAVASLAALAGGYAFRFVAPADRTAAARVLTAVTDVTDVAATRALPVERAAPEPVPSWVALPFAESPSTEPSARPALHASRDAAWTVTVLVQDEGGAPFPGAEVRVATRHGFETRATSDAAGRAELTLAPGDVAALDIPAAREHVALRAHARSRAASAVLFVPDTWTRGEPLVLTLAGPEHVLRGRATDERGRALADVEVFALPDPHHTSLADPTVPFLEPLGLGTRTDADGRYELHELSALDHVLCIRRPDAEPLLLPTEPREQVDLRLRSGGALRGRILDEHGAPAPGARVWIEPLHRGTEWCAGLPGFERASCGFTLATTTDAEGNYELRGLQSRERRVFARSAGDPACTVSAIVPIVARETSNWSAFLTREPGLHLRLVDADRKPLSRWTVKLVSLRKDGPRWMRWLETDERGSVACFDAVGEADLAIHDPTGLGQPWLTRRIRPTGEEQELVVDESHFGILAGRLADAFGNVPAGMHLEAYETSARMPVPIRLDAKTGRFRSQLQPGTYRLVALGDHGGASLGNAEVASGERSRMGRVDPPALGQVELRADRPRNGGNYRLQVCFGHTAVKWKEGALPLFLDEPLHAGLYRLDASDDEGVLQSGWVEVRAGSASALDLGALPRVQVEARAHSDPSAAVWLTVLPAGAPEPPAEDPQRRILFSRRSDGRCLHTLRLPPGRWKLTAEEKGEESAGAETVVDVEEGGNARVLLDLVRRPR